MVCAVGARGSADSEVEGICEGEECAGSSGDLKISMAQTWSWHGDPTPSLVTSVEYTITTNTSPHEFPLRLSSAERTEAKNKP
jgi:hypothetical protein